MSKHLLEAEDQNSQTCACGSGTMALNIRLMDQDEQGNPTSADDTRYVRISDSSGTDEIHPLRLVNGEAYIRLEQMSAAQFTLVQVDETGNQMINGDVLLISYIVDGRMQDDDYARVYGTCEEEHEVQIFNQPMMPTTLNIVKVLVDEFQEPLEFSSDMNFTVRISGMGICETIDLNAENNFEVCLNTLRAGIYEVSEEKMECWSTAYNFDGTVMKESSFQLNPGDHRLEIVNTRRPATVLTLDKYIRDVNGELIKPQNGECFHIRVLGDYYDQIYELNGENDFALDICDLPAGLYDVSEVDHDGCEVSYLVNSAPESSYAHVELKCCDCASVLIINSVCMCEQESPLRICKYVRRSDNCLVKPDPCESFKVMLSGCGVCEIFNLNAGNNFCVDIEHICCGEYEVKELDHDGYIASYIVNDGCESTTACLFIHEGGCNCVTIINEERNKGEVTICKVIRQKDGTMCKPDKSQRFLVTLRSFFCRETFVLDASNDFCVHVYRLKEGSYEVKERCLDEFDTTYMINGCKEERKARFVVMNECCTDVKVINSVKKEMSGDLRICKYIANAFGDYVKPSADEEFEISVQGPCVDSCYTLRAANNWCVILEGLKKGVYRVEERDHCRYDAQYFVNGCEMEEAALVCMEQENQEVSIVNTKQNNGNLKLSVLVEDCDSCLHKPNQSEYFDVLVESAQGSRMVRLDCRNNFGVLLEDLEAGRIRIIQKDSYGYRVSYDVNGERSNGAVVEMNGCNQSVTVINRVMDCAGVVRVKKLVETLNGRIIKPCDEDCYSFTLTSKCINTEATLHEKNDFCVFFDDLEEGEYEIKEACVDGMKTRYCINGKESESGCFKLTRDDVEIEIINKVLPLPKLCVQKRIKEHGTLCKPQDWERFNFQLIGRGLHETYCLSKENDWCICLDGLCNQHYEIRELDVNCPVMYQINDCLSESGSFLFANEDLEITIINDAGSDAIVNIRKLMRDLNGELIKPCRDDCFEAVLESDCFKQCFTLNRGNDWCVAVEGLPCGTYTVSENNSDCRYEVLIDHDRNKSCDSMQSCGSGEDASFTLDDHDIDITIINPIGCENALVIAAKHLLRDKRSQPDKASVYHIHVEHEGVCDEFVLDESNEWCIELCNIVLGDYRIFADEMVIYESDGACFENCIEISMGCETTCVTLLDEQEEDCEITITKRIRKGDGSLRRPPCGSRFTILFCGRREQCFDLSEENDWTVQLCNYPFGSYEVIEPDCAASRYQINDGPIKRHGRFVFDGEDVAMTVINPDTEEDEPCDVEPPLRQGGGLTIHSMVKNCDGDLETAPADASFDVMIDGDDVREDITLTHRNGFARTYDQLPKGAYLITQKPNEHYTRVTYRVRGVEQPTGEIVLGQDDVHVDMINYMNCERGSIRVMKYIKDASCGCLKRPCMEEQYTITISGNGLCQSIILNSSNKWSYVFENLADGTYRIEEEQDGITYIVNGGKEQTDAYVKLEGSDANVKVISPSAASVHGSIELCKYVRDEQGNNQEPSRDQSYWVTISGEGVRERVLLHPANHFFAEVRHLLPGTYEIEEEDGEGMLYSVNGGKESAKAVVAVNANQNAVNIIHPSAPQSANMTLTKYVQTCDGRMIQPTSGRYRVHVSAPGYNEVFTLEESNSYAYVLRNLRKGLYVVDELDHDDVTYIIDGGSQVDRAVVNVQANHIVSIINQDRSEPDGGGIKMTKYIRNTKGQLIRPTGSASYQFHVSKPGFNEVYTLNQSNQWGVTLNNLSSGNYVISEVDNPSNVSYIINDGSETDFGIVSVSNNQNTVSIINSEATANGSLTITKYMRDDQGQLTRPTGDFSASVHVSRTGYNEVFTLNRANNWEIRLLDLLDGQYVLDEVDSEHDVTWRINGGNEVRYAVVNVAHNANQVDMINMRKMTGSAIHLQKYIRNAAGQLVKPEGSEAFTILISGTRTMRVVLNQANNWQEHLDNLPNGTYHIKESNASYDVSYMINNGEEQSSATLVLNNNDASVNVINAVRGSRNLLEITKYIKTAQGSLIPPVSGDAFQIQVTGSSFQQTFTLNADNNFTERVTNLANGTYTVKELGGDDYITTYRVNGGQETTSAIVTVADGKNNVVETINERKANQNTLDVYKFIMDGQGNFNKPQPSQVFRFLLTGSNVHQFYTLSSANDWHVMIEPLASGEYEVIEQSNGRYQVQYLVNGTDFSSTGEFVASAGNQNIVEIVNSQRTENNGSIDLEKKVRNSDGDLVIPGNGESFSIRLISQENNYDEIFTLDELNGYTLRVPSLAFGVYTVEEVDNSGYGVTYIVNNGPEGSGATLNIQSAVPQNVMVINTQTSLFFQVSRNDDLHIVIE